MEDVDNVSMYVVSHRLWNCGKQAKEWPGGKTGPLKRIGLKGVGGVTSRSCLGIGERREDGLAIRPQKQSYQNSIAMQMKM